MVKKIWTSESVTEGHPDKVADLISDTVLDYMLEQDPLARVACETFLPGREIIIGGEITATKGLTTDLRPVEERVRAAIRGIGYTKDISPGFNDESTILWMIKGQSRNISDGVDTGGAGDQGFMIGYAVQESPNLMPWPITLAHDLTKRLAEARKKNTLPFLRPDGKSQVSFEYEDNKPVAITHITIAAQHAPGTPYNKIVEGIIEEVIKKSVPEELLEGKNLESLITINGTGTFEIGGPEGDTGLTGRKIIVDTYGGRARHGGGAFSGKDATKVDRSAAYMARYVAKNIVASGLARECEVHLGYAIGKSEPTSIGVELFDPNLDVSEYIKLIKKEFKLTPKEIIETLELRKPIFSGTTNYGHFGKEGFSWERIDKAELLRKGYLNSKIFST